MTIIRIRQQEPAADGWEATLSFDSEGEYPVKITRPFDAEEEGLLAWYFEGHLRYPFTDQVKAQAAAASVARYGESLFNQVFADRKAYARYAAVRQAGLEDVLVEVAGEPEFHGLHWETLKDPDLSDPLTLHAPMVRKNLTPREVEAVLRESPTINVLLVTARPSGPKDVGYRTISRPLIEGLRQADLRVRIDILRPGTYEALLKQLERVKAGHYHVVHFDVHGALATFDQLKEEREADRLLFQTRYGRGEIEEYDGQRAFLFLNGPEPGRADPVEAGELADMLTTQQVPIVILNACQSGMQVGSTETSLGARLMQSGVQLVLAMGYSVTVSAAELMMRTLYGELFAGNGLPAAIRRARQELHHDKGRRAYFNQTIDLEDWMLPVVYQNRAQELTVREFTKKESMRYYEEVARQFAFPQPTYGFFGRDLDVLECERRLLACNVLLIRGMGGAGKTTLLKHLAAWWQTTHWIERVFYFGYDERAWTRGQIVDAIAQAVLERGEYHTEFQPLGEEAQEAMLVERLRGRPHLLILDNLESITGAELAIQNTLSQEEQDKLRGFLSKLLGVKTLVLLGSRGGEEWLAPGTFGDNVHDLPGLDPEAASDLADVILAKLGVTEYAGTEELQRLLRLLAGFPLALEVVLANLSHETPAEILAGLEAGDVKLDSPDAQEKTRSILRCIDYSHSNLSPDAQALLVCLAPFTSVVYEPILEKYAAELGKEPVVADLPFDRWPEVLKEATSWGLMSPHPVGGGFLQLQPIFPYFLRNRLQDANQSGVREAVQAAFRRLYDQLADQMYGLLESKEAQEKQLGQALVKLEYENLSTALNLALDAQVSILEPYRALSGYLDTTQDQKRGLELGETVLSRLEDYPEESLAGQLGAEFVGVIDDIASRQLLLKQYERAQSSYEKALSIWLKNKGFDAREIRRRSASIYHQLGRVAEEQREWEQAEQHYRKALEIKIEFNDRYSQASTYHQLGRVAEEQRKWEQAEQHYRKALEIKIEFNDRYSQAATYHQLGMVAQKQREWEQAEQHYRKALEIYVEFNDRYEQADVYHQLGMVAEEQREWEQAEQHYRRALEIFVEFDDRYSQASTYHQLGMVAQEQREWEQAEQHYRKALEIYVEFNDRYSQASTYHQLGIVAREQERWDQARGYFLRALETFVAYEDSHSVSVTLGNLARLWRSSGDAGLPAAVAGVLGCSEAEAEELLRAAVSDD